MEIVAYIIYGVLVSIFGWFMATVIIDVPQMSRDTDRLNDTVKRIEKIMKDMKKIPPVTPQQKTGRWIFREFDEGTGISNSYWYSACNYPMAQVYDDCCAHCGAKMEREGEKNNADNT